MNYSFWRTKFVLADLEDLRRLQESGIKELWINSERGLDVCLRHHEKIDGSGYPHRLKNQEISVFAKMGVVLDQSPKSLLTPMVKVFFSTKSQAYLNPEVVDLSRPGCPEKIVDKEDVAKWGIKNLHELWAGPTQ